MTGAAKEWPNTRWNLRFGSRLSLERAQFAFTLTQGFLDLASIADIDERNDDAIDLVVNGPVRTQAHVVPFAGPAFQLAADGSKVGKDRSRVLDQTVVFELMRKVGNGPALVSRGNAEQLGRPFGESLYAQARVEKQRAEIGCSHQVLQIAMRARDCFELQLQLAVDRLQLLVVWLHLLRACLDLFRG